MKTRRAIYPGSFDPVTNGHLDIIERGAHFFEEVLVAVLVNTKKETLFTIHERVDMLEKVVKGFKNVRVDGFTGLTAEYAKQMGALAIIRGLREVSDFDLEFRFALVNRKLNPDVETIFFMTSPDYLFISSSIIKELVSLGGEVGGFVPPYVLSQLKKKYAPNR